MYNGIRKALLGIPAHPPESLARNENSTMNRKLLLRFTIPSVIIGLFLFTACLVSIRYIHRLQANLADVLNQNVISLQAAKELEIQVRQLRFHTVLHLLNPQKERLARIKDDQAKF